VWLVCPRSVARLVRDRERLMDSPLTAVPPSDRPIPCWIRVPASWRANRRLRHESKPRDASGQEVGMTEELGDAFAYGALPTDAPMDEVKPF
jgi:hypothetical protein